MDDEKVMEIIKAQTRPKIHVGIEEKIPTVQYGNKTYTVNISDFVDNIHADDIKKLLNEANEAIKEQKRKDGLIPTSSRKLTKKEEKMAKDAVDAFVKQKTETDKTKSKASDLLERAFENV